MSIPRVKVLIVGGGVAALEACLGLHWDRSIDADVTLVSRSREFVYRPLAILEPFGHQPAPSYPIKEILSTCSPEIIYNDVAAIDPAGGEARIYAGRTLEFDAAIVATGTEPRASLRNAIVIGAHGSMERLAILVAQIDAGLVDRVVFTVPAAPSWSLPIYELAMYTAAHAKHRARDVEVQLITPEEHPLIDFGAAASDSVVKLLAENDVRLDRGVRALNYDGQVLEMSDGRSIETSYVVALPELAGVPIAGLTHDEHGFLPVDDYGRVAGTTNVFAAGDITDFPIKQGGIATQQADVVVGAVTEQFGGSAALHPFEPELRGLLFSPNGRDLLRSGFDDGADSVLNEQHLSALDAEAEKIISVHLSARLKQLAHSRAPLR